MATATMQQRSNKDAKAIGYGAAGGRGNKAIDKRNQIILCMYVIFPYYIEFNGLVMASMKIKTVQTILLSAV
jgi:hypothetical protein